MNRLQTLEAHGLKMRVKEAESVAEAAPAEVVEEVHEDAAETAEDVDSTTAE